MIASITAILAVSLIGYAYAADIAGHLDIKNAFVNTSGNNAVLKVTTVGNINDGIPPGFYGYAALTSDFQNMLAATYHEPIVDSEEQPGWHSHIVSAGASKICDSGIQVTGISFEAPGHTVVDGDTIVVNQVPTDLVGDVNGVVLSFNLTIEGHGKKTAVCINPVDTN